MKLLPTNFSLCALLLVLLLVLLPNDVRGIKRSGTSYLRGNNVAELYSITRNKSSTLDDLEEKNKAVLNMFLREMLPLAIKISKEARLSIRCAEAVHHVIRGTRELKDWAIGLLDASGRSPAGLFDGTATDFGDFDECLDIEVSRTSTATARVMGMSFQGKYCLVQTSLPQLLKLPPEKKGDSGNGSIIVQLQSSTTIFNRLLRLRDSGRYFAGRLGLCLPSVCSEDDVTRGLQMFAEPFELSIEVVSCTVKGNAVWRAEQIFIAVFLSVILGLCLAGTLLDTLLRQEVLYKTIPDSVKNKKQLGVRFLLAFSVYSNTLKLITVPDEPSALGALCGFRFLSILWIILAHTYFFPIVPFFFRLRRLLSYIDFREQFLYGAVNNASVSVDTFFFVSGFLVTYIMGKKFLGPRGGSLRLSSFVIRRILRLMPAMLLTIALFLLFPLMGDGPQWKEFVDDNVKTCRSGWWKNLLFIQNFWDIKDNCLFHTWFLAVTMQFCVISVPLLWLIFKKPKFGILSTIAVAILSAVITGYVTASNNFPPAVALTVIDSSIWDELLSKIYIRPYTHMGPYCIGLLVGYFLAKKEKVVLTRFQQLWGWTVAFLCMLICIFGLFKFNYRGDQYLVFSSLYAALNRSLWAIAVGWITVACVTGHGGVVNRILAWKVFVPLDKLVYFAYLLHPLIMFYYHGQARERLFFGHVEMIIHYLGFAALSFTLAYFCYIGVELPISFLDTLMYPKSKPIATAASRPEVTTKIMTNNTIPIETGTTETERINETQNASESVTVCIRC